MIKPAFDNTKLFSKCLPTGKETIMSIHATLSGVLGTVDICPLPLFGSNFLSSGYNKFLDVANELDSGTGRRVNIFSVQGSSKAWSANSSKNPLLTFSPDDGVNANIVEIASTQNSYVDILELSRFEYWKVKKMRLVFNTITGNFKDGLDQTRMKIHSYTNDLFGRGDYQSATIADYFKPDNKARDNGQGAIFDIDIPMNNIVSGSSLIAVSIWKEILLKTSITIHLTVEKYYLKECNH